MPARHNAGSPATEFPRIRIFVTRPAGTKPALDPLSHRGAAAYAVVTAVVCCDGRATAAGTAEAVLTRGAATKRPAQATAAAGAAMTEMDLLDRRKTPRRIGI